MAPGYRILGSLAPARSGDFMFRLFPFCVVASSVCLAARAPAVTAPASSPPGITVTDGGQVEKKNQPITVEAEAPAPGPYRVQAAALNYAITYQAQVLPVTVGGSGAQANDVLIAGDRAYI